MLLSRLSLVLLALSVLAFSPPARAADEPVPLLVALDSSRSLRAAELTRARDLVAGLVRQLPGTPIGLLTFDDEARIVVPPGDPARVVDALEAVELAGRYTVLHDALVLGARTLANGGVLLLLTDALDENSATTFEDAARLATEHGVRVLAVAVGRADERTLRRLALLTSGAYAGRLEAIGPEQVGVEAEGLTTAIAGARRAAAPPPPPPAPAPEPAPVPPPAPAAGLPPLAWLGLALLLAALAAGVGYLLARRRPEPIREETLTDFRPEPVAAPTPCPRCDRPLAANGVCSFCHDTELAAQLRARAVVPPGQLLEISLDDTASFSRIPFSEAIEKTFVLAEETVLVVREPGRDPRTLRLPPERAISVGRDRQQNTLAFADPTLSSQHFRVAPQDGIWYLLDQNSTNGLFVGGERVHLARLRPGEPFRAGQLEFELQIHQQSLN
jgi:hypothetical protein